MVESTEREIGEGGENYVLRKDRSCSDLVFIVRNLCEYVKEKKKVSFQTFLYLENAKDRVHRNVIQ